MIDLNQHKLELEYPCSWPYKLIVLEKTNITKVVKEVVGEREHSVKQSKSSSKGKFVSYTLELLVHSDDDRTTLHELLRKHTEIKMIV